MRVEPMKEEVMVKPFWSEMPESVFWQPVDIRSSSWTGHVPFAFWIVDVLRPRALAELGTWYGMSYLAFCQAVKALAIDTRATAVDTWQGDHQTGKIASDALISLRQAHDPKYASFSTLRQATFDEAADTFKEGALDLLHIDGLHTYEAVRHDFETWLPKLSNRAVVLFHDTQERHGDFGVYRFWEEVTAKYPHFEFYHEHGLGVLGVGSDMPVGIRNLLEATGEPEDAHRIRTIFERFGSALRAKGDQEALHDRLNMIAGLPEIRAALKFRRLVGAPV